MSASQTNYLKPMYVVEPGKLLNSHPRDLWAAVGDAAFQKKCFDRMEEIINQGRTAILVNHEMSQVRRMSQHCLWLRHGQVEMFGPTNGVVSYYEQETGGSAESSVKATELAHSA